MKSRARSATERAAPAPASRSVPVIAARVPAGSRSVTSQAAARLKKLSPLNVYAGRCQPSSSATARTGSALPKYAAPA